AVGGTHELFHHRCPHREVARILDRKAKVDLPAEIGRLDVRQQQRGPTPARRRDIGIGLRRLTAIPRRKGILVVVVAVQRQTELVQIVQATGSIGCVPYLLHGRQQESDQDGDDRNYYQQLDECKSQTTQTRPSRG